MNIGEELQRKRKLNGLSLERIHRDIKVSITYLEALEQNRFDAFPAEVYLLGNLRKYAGYLSLDPDPFIRELRAQKVVCQPAATRVTEKSSHQADPEKQELFAFSGTFARGVLALALIIAFIGGLLGLFGWYSHALYKVKAQEREMAYGKFRFFKGQAGSEYNTPEELVVSITARKKIWLQLKDTDKLFFEGFLPQNGKMVFASKHPFRLFVESLEALAIILNDIPVPVAELVKRDAHRLVLTTDYYQELRRLATLRGTLKPTAN